MKTRTRRFSAYLLKFALWTLVCWGLYYLLFPFYSKLILLLAGAGLDIFTTTDVSLFHVRDQGIAVTYPGARGPVGIRYSLFSVAHNVMFAPALVMTTLGLSWRAGLAALASIAVMALLHGLHLVIIVMHFLTQAPHPLISERFPSFLAASIHWSYAFADKMGYTLFPFIAWFIVSGGVLFQLLRPAPAAQASSSSEAENASQSASEPPSGSSPKSETGV